MKKLNSFILAGLMMMAYGVAFAENTASPTQAPGDKVKVQHCAMCNYTAPMNCPLCGMKMAEKEMTAVDAQAAIDASKEKMKNRG